MKSIGILCWFSFSFSFSLFPFFNGYEYPRSMHHGLVDIHQLIHDCVNPKQLVLIPILERGNIAARQLSIFVFFQNHPTYQILLWKCSETRECWSSNTISIRFWIGRNLGADLSNFLSRIPKFGSNCSFLSSCNYKPLIKPFLKPQNGQQLKPPSK